MAPNNLLFSTACGSSNTLTTGITTEILKLSSTPPINIRNTITTITRFCLASNNLFIFLNIFTMFVSQFKFSFLFQNTSARLKFLSTLTNSLFIYVFDILFYHKTIAIDNYYLSLLHFHCKNISIFHLFSHFCNFSAIYCIFTNTISMFASQTSILRKSIFKK